MSKTPEEMAEEYRENHDECEFARDAFLAGYKAAQDQLADADKVMPQWISVKERLPEMNVVALVFSKLTYLNVAHRVVDDKGWCWATVSMSIAPYEITHWIPLPEPPKEEE